MEEAVYRKIPLSSIAAISVAVLLALMLAVKALTAGPSLPAPVPTITVDRIMTDEVQTIKVGQFVWGSPTPKGGLPELKGLIASSDFSAAGKVVDGIRERFSSVKAELNRRGGPSDASLRFEANLHSLEQSIASRKKSESAALVGRAFGLWRPVEADLSRTHVDAGTFATRGLLFLVIWGMLTYLLAAAAGRGKAIAVAQEANHSDRIRGIDLMRSRVIRRLLISPTFPAALQAFSLIFLVATIAIGFMGPFSTSENAATVLFWSLWWSPVMMISLILFGKVWCGMCPIGGLTSFVERLGIKRKLPDVSRPFRIGVLALTPVTISVFSFVLMREPLYGVSYAVTSTPVRTAAYFGVWIMMAVAVSLLFERRAWCRYFCPVAAATSVVAKLAPVEFIQSRSAGVTNCSTLEYGGNYLTSERRCLYCLKCTQAFTDATVHARFRFPGSALFSEKHIGAEAAMALVLVAVFPIGHGLGQLPVFQTEILSELRVAYFAAIAGSLGAYALATRLSAYLAKQDFSEVFARFGSAYAPLGVLFSLGMAGTSILKSAGNWLNVTLPYFGIYGYHAPAVADQASIAAWQHWSMSWMTPLGGLWALGLTWLLARGKIKATAWLPQAVLIVAFVVLAKALPMPMH